MATTILTFIMNKKIFLLFINKYLLLLHYNFKTNNHVKNR